MAEQREAVRFLVAGSLSIERACQLVAIQRSTFRSVAHLADDGPLLAKIKELTERHPRYGYRRISALLRREEPVNQKRVRRLWRQHRLQVPRISRQRRLRKPPTQHLVVAYPGHIWAYDFVEDALLDGTPLRILTVMDEFTREGLALDVDVSASAERDLDTGAEISTMKEFTSTAETMHRRSPGHVLLEGHPWQLRPSMTSPNAQV